MLRNVFNMTSFVTGLGLMLYFFVMDILNLSQYTELRLFNAIILGLGIWFVIKRESMKGDEFGVSYLHGWKRSFQVIIGSVLIFDAFMMIYLGVSNSQLIEALHAQYNLPEAFGVFHLAVIILIEGLASGVILTLLIMQYYKYTEVPEASGSSA